MPNYQYECTACGYLMEVFQSMLEKKLKKCPKCGKNTLTRLIGTGSGIIFKGSGFYETDYKNKSASKVNTKKAESSECKSCKHAQACREE